jgi:phosphoribosylanthranilate isomerase
MTSVKICGLTNLDDSLTAAAAGADYLGYVFSATSRRQVTAQRAAQIVSGVRVAGYQCRIVGVFVNAPISEINDTAIECSLDYVQLSGDETWEYCLLVDRPLLKAVHVSLSSLSADVSREIEAGYRLLGHDRFTCLLDTQVKGAYGGTGRVFNWQLAREITKAFPIFVAGGLDPQNVQQLIQEIAPRGVDVSSGVETNGTKDGRKIREFVERAKGELNNQTSNLKTTNQRSKMGVHH